MSSKLSIFLFYEQCNKPPHFDWILSRENFFKKFRLNVWQIHHFGGVYSEGVWEYPNKEKCDAFLEKGTLFLYKMKRLLKAETDKTPADKGKEVRYNEDSNLSVGRSLQEE